MLPVFLFGLRETLYRRTGIILLVVGLLITGALLYLLDFETGPDGTVMVTTVGGMSAPAEQSVPRLLDGIGEFATSLWILVVLFAAAPLLTSFMDAGWVELQISKSVPRWQIVLGRYLTAVAVIALALLLIPGAAGIYFWVQSGIPSLWRLTVGLLLLGLSYGAVLALMSAVSILQSSPIIPIMVGYLLLAMSATLKNREVLYGLITAKWAQALFDWTYYLLPKTSELGDAGLKFIEQGVLTAWWPVWTTALFLLAMVGVAVLLFQRKSF